MATSDKCYGYDPSLYKYIAQSPAHVHLLCSSSDMETFAG